MAVKLSVTLDTKDLRRLSALTGRAKFAGAKALTLTAKDAQARLQAEVRGVFHLRNNWVPKGIRIRAATPGTMTAAVGSIDKYMGRHVFGDDKAPEQALSIRRSRDSRGRLASGGLLIPGYGSIGDAPTHTASRRRLARIDKQKRKTFQISTKGGNVMIVRRTGKKRAPLEVLAGLYNRADDKPIWRIDRTVSAVVGARFGVHFEAAIAAL